jgi:endonuclease YncB( thermonuclease family)
MLSKTKVPFILSMFIFLSIPHVLEAWEGEVIKVVDGDTIVVNKEGKSITINLDGIDAPEKNQAFGKEAEEFLASMVLNKKVEIKEKGVSKDGRLLADVYVLKGYKRCVNEELLRNGLAWYDDTNSKSNKLSSIVKVARQEKRGLWTDTNAIPPWEYNKSHANKEKEENDKVAIEKQKAFEEQFLKEYFSENAIKARAASEKESGKGQEKEERQEKAKKKYRGCEIVSFSQHEVSSGSGHVVGGHVTAGGTVVGGTVMQHKETCVDVTIINDDRDEKVITNENIVAITEKDVVLKWSQRGHWRNGGFIPDGAPTPEKTSKEITSKNGFSIRIEPGGTYNGTICFGRQLPQIVKLEYRH